MVALSNVAVRSSHEAETARKARQLQFITAYREGFPPCRAASIGRHSVSPSPFACNSTVVSETAMHSSAATLGLTLRANNLDSARVHLSSPSEIL